MNKYLLVITILAFSSISFAQSVSLEFVSELETIQEFGNPLALAADNDGGIYYTLLSVGDNASGAYYISNPLDNPSPEDHIEIDAGLDFTIPNGRGITGIAVDNIGNVYLAFDTGNNDTGNLTKRLPAPNFELDENFGDFGSVFGKRYNSVEVLTDDIIAASLFDTVEFFDANDGTPLHLVSGGELFQRDLAFDPMTNDIYISKNSGGVPASSANILSGGSPDNLTGYTTIEPNFIPQGAALGQFGIKHQKLDFDVENRLIIIPQYSPAEPLPEGETFQDSVAFYSPDDTSEPVAAVDGSESPGGPFDLIGDAVAVQIDGENYVFITDTNPDSLKRILIYRLSTEVNSVNQWNVHN